MTNKKIKKYNVHRLAKVLERARDIDYCGVWLALLDSGMSKKKVLEFFDDFHNNGVPQLQQDADDEILAHKVYEFLIDVQIVPEYIEQVPKRHIAEIMTAFQNGSYDKAIQSNCTDFMVLMYYVHKQLGYGHIRLMRIVDFIMRYQGDPRKEVQERLNITYPADDELPDTTDIFKKRKTWYDKNEVFRMRREMDAVRVIQGGEK